MIKSQVGEISKCISKTTAMYLPDNSGKYAKIAYKGALVSPSTEEDEEQPNLIPLQAKYDSKSTTFYPMPQLKESKTLTDKDGFQLVKNKKHKP